MDSPNVILLGVTGSTAYGMATPESDIDRQGVFQVDTWDVLSRIRGDETNPELKGIDSIQQHNPDVALHELAKYMRLAAECNPTAFEVLWLPEYEVLTESGRMLVDHRHLFLSQNVRHRYGGYARSQVNRLVRRGDSFDPDVRPAKHGRHVARLLFQAEQLLGSGVLSVRLDDEQVEWCFEAGRLAESDPEGFANKMLPAIDRLDEMPTDLPEKPDMAAIRDLLLTIRLKDH